MGLFSFLFGSRDKAPKNPDPHRALEELITSFSTALSPEENATFASLVDQGEEELALGLLADWIYGGDIPVTPEQEAAILQSFRDFHADTTRLVFIGRHPPYP